MQNKYVRRRIYIYDKDIDKVFMLKHVNDVWNKVQAGDTVLAERSKLTYDGKDYYRYSILLKENN